MVRALPKKTSKQSMKITYNEYLYIKFVLIKIEFSLHSAGVHRRVIQKNRRHSSSQHRRAKKNARSLAIKKNLKKNPKKRTKIEIKRRRKKKRKKRRKKRIKIRRINTITKMKPRIIKTKN